MTRTDNKLTLAKIHFSLKNYNHLFKKNIGKLSTTAHNLFHFIESFGKLHNITDLVSVWMLQDPIQKTKIYIGGAFQLFFFENIFGALEDQILDTNI